VSGRENSELESSRSRNKTTEGGREAIILVKEAVEAGLTVQIDPLSGVP
jgi:hypothetical protein